MARDSANADPARVTGARAITPVSLPIRLATVTAVAIGLSGERVWLKRRHEVPDLAWRAQRDHALRTVELSELVEDPRTVLATKHRDVLEELHKLAVGPALGAARRHVGPRAARVHHASLEHAIE